jgi:hypothetical protein
MGAIMDDAISSISPIKVITPLDTVIDKKFDDGNSKKPNRQSKTTIKNVIEDGKVIVEQYDRHGRLIRKTPPGYLPPGQKS